MLAARNTFACDLSAFTSQTAHQLSVLHYNWLLEKDDGVTLNPVAAKTNTTNELTNDDRGDHLSGEWSRLELVSRPRCDRS